VLVALGLLVLATAAIAVFELRGSGGKSFRLEAGVPTEASVGELRSYASPSRPVFWAGAPSSGRMEVTHTARGALYVRYLPPGVELGDRAPVYTTIATYPMPNALAAMKRSAAATGFSQARAPRGGLAVWRRSRPTSVYLAYPGRDFLVEVFDPSPSRARTLATGGDVSRVR
jgi:hypothetical protein